MMKNLFLPSLFALVLLSTSVSNVLASDDKNW